MKSHFEVSLQVFEIEDDDIVDGETFAVLYECSSRGEAQKMHKAIVQMVESAKRGAKNTLSP